MKIHYLILEIGCMLLAVYTRACDLISLFLEFKTFFLKLLHIFYFIAHCEVAVTKTWL